MDVLVALYDEFASEYERTRVPRFRPFVKKLLQLYDTRPGSQVLDAGCGTGLAAAMVAPRVGPGGRVLGVDASEKMLEIARHKAHGFGFDQCEFVLGDMAHLDVPNDAFDVVICSFALWNEPRALFAEFLRVLKPHGALLAQNWSRDKDAPTAAFNTVAAQYLNGVESESLQPIRDVMAQSQLWWEQLGTPEDYAALLRTVGFSSVRSEWCALPMHFGSGDEFIEFQNLSVWRRSQVARLDDATRTQFLADAKGALRPFETAKGLSVEQRAIQLSARK